MPEPKPTPDKNTNNSGKEQQDDSHDLGLLVQMSHEWIRKNIKSAVPDEVSDTIILKRNKIYSRHLFFSPYYHLSGSPKAHMEAKHAGKPASEHEKHEAFHYGEGEVRIAVNKCKKKLSKEFGNHPNLKEEK